MPALRIAAHLVGPSHAVILPNTCADATPSHLQETGQPPPNHPLPLMVVYIGVHGEPPRHALLPLATHPPYHIEQWITIAGIARIRRATAMPRSMASVGEAVLWKRQRCDSGGSFVQSAGTYRTSRSATHPPKVWMMGDSTAGTGEMQWPYGAASVVGLKRPAGETV